MGFIERIFYNLFQVHPFHAMVVHFPIALTGAALFFIVLALIWRSSKSIEPIAFANIALAAVATIAAGITGWLDNRNIWGGDILGGGAPNSGVKMILASILFLVTAVTAYMRWGNPGLFSGRGRVFYIAAYFISFGLALTLAFLGGVILYGFQEVP